MTAPTPAQPTDPNGVLIRAKDFPAEGWEFRWIRSALWYRSLDGAHYPDDIIEARPIPEPTIDVRLTVSEARAFGKVLILGNPSSPLKSGQEKTLEALANREQDR